MNRFVKILMGVGIVAGISYYGRGKLSPEQIAMRGAGTLGYLKGMGQGFYLGCKHTFRFLGA